MDTDLEALKKSLTTKVSLSPATENQGINLDVANILSSIMSDLQRISKALIKLQTTVSDIKKSTDGYHDFADSINDIQTQQTSLTEEVRKVNATLGFKK